MTLDRTVIDCPAKFWEHGQLYVALFRVKSPQNIHILLPPEIDDFSIHPVVDQDVVNILDSDGPDTQRPTPVFPGDLDHGIDPDDLVEELIPISVAGHRPFRANPTPLVIDPGENRTALQENRWRQISTHAQIVCALLAERARVRFSHLSFYSARFQASICAAIQICKDTDSFPSQEKTIANLNCLQAPARTSEWSRDAEIPRPLLPNSHETAYANPILSVLFHILPLRVLFTLWPIEDPE